VHLRFDALTRIGKHPTADSKHQAGGQEGGIPRQLIGTRPDVVDTKQMVVDYALDQVEQPPTDTQIDPVNRAEWAGRKRNRHSGCPKRRHGTCCAIQRMATGSMSPPTQRGRQKRSSQIVG
jgi:hypothetical protein